MERLLEFYRICSDQTRLRILMLLLADELCVCEIQGILNLSQPKVSKHLAKLRDAGYVQTTRQDQFIHYKLSLSDSVLIRHLDDLKAHISDYPLLEKDSSLLADKDAYLKVCSTKRT